MSPHSTDRWLLVLDIPDERLAPRHQFDHMHSWFGTPGEAQLMQRILEDEFGGTHVIVDMDDPGAVCPRCGKGRKWFRRT